jgi:hypothetical protein
MFLSTNARSQRLRRLVLATVMSAFALLLVINATSANAFSIYDRAMIVGEFRAPTSGTVQAGSTAEIAKVVSGSTKGRYQLSCGIAAGADAAASWRLTYISDVSDRYSVTTSGTSTAGSSTRTLDYRTVQQGIGSSVGTELAFAFGGLSGPLSVDVLSQVRSVTGTYWLDAKRFKITQPLGGSCAWSFANA